MRMSVAALMCTVAVTAQDYPAGQVKHISLPVVNSAKPFAVSAREIDRDVPFPAVIHLKGAVEIKMPVCVVTGPGTGQTCAGEIVFHAEEADLHEDTGQIEAKGAARITRQ